MNGLLLFSGIIFIFWLGSSIFIPLLFATFLWYLTNAIATYYRKIMPFKQTQSYKLNILFNILSKILAIASFIILLLVFITQIRPMFSELLTVLPEIQNNLNLLLSYISNTIGIQINQSSIPNINDIVSNIGSTIARLATSMGIVLVYILFMFIEQRTFNKKFAALFTNRGHSKKVRYILNSINENMKKYLFMKTFISVSTGFLSFIWLHMLGIQFAGIWGFIIFILNYIPTIGSIIACTLPIIFSLVSSDSPHQTILTTTGLITLQIILGNIVEPKLTGKTLNLSTLAILINMVFWGLIWGFAGMFFSVPLLVATFIITAQFDSTRWIAILLSADGKIPDKRDEID